MKMAEHKATLDFTKALSPVLRLRESVGSLSASGPSEADQRWQEKGLKRIPTLEWRPGRPERQHCGMSAEEETPVQTVATERTNKAAQGRTGP
jgi:hypothetical protein